MQQWIWTDLNSPPPFFGAVLSTFAHANKKNKQKNPGAVRWKSRTMMESYFPVLLYANERLYVDRLSGDL